MIVLIKIAKQIAYMKKLVLGFILLFSMVGLNAQNLNLKGKVTDDNGLPLEGVSIKVNKTTKGTQTNKEGNFQITLNLNQTLAFSYIGFEDLTFVVKDQKDLTIKLTKTNSSLDEVVVVGYGTIKKKDLTGSIISLKPEEITKVTSSNIMEALQGKLSGVDIVRTSGGAGATANVTIRGNRSIIAGNGPLYIVDGIQYSEYQDINPNDIQSMEVLKDASSTAIYGSRGANGVILITTKKGTTGKTKIHVGTYYGNSDVAGYPIPMDGSQFADLKRQAYATTGKWNSNADDATIFTTSELAGIAKLASGNSTYWPGQILGQGHQQDYNVGVSGGNDKTKVYFSFDYLKEQGLLKNDFSNKYSLHLNIDQSLSNTLKVGLQNQLTYYNNNNRNDGVLTLANKIKPLYVPYDSLGNIIISPGSDNQFNPLLDDVSGTYVNETKITRVLSNAYLEWKPISGLSLRSNFGIVTSSSMNGYFAASTSVDRLSSTGSLSKITNGKSNNLTWENILNYTKKIGDHNIELTAVTSYLSNKTDSSYAQGTGQLLANQSYFALQNNPSNLGIYSNYVGSDLLSGALRINYNYKGKYLLNITAREDGSSVLSEQNRWALFPSVALGWRVIDEDFMKSQTLFNDLKLRASYGISGNAAVKPYQTQSGLTLIPFSWNDQSALAYGLNSQIGNPNLKWELTSTLNLGVDFALLKNKVRVNADYYESNTSDLLLLMQLPQSTGVQRILQNFGKTSNKGFEISVATENIKTKAFSWNTTFSFMTNKEKIVLLPNGQNDVANKLFIGSPVKSFFDYQKIGIWQTTDSTLAKSFGYKPGDIRVADLNGDGKITADDRQVLGAAVPSYSFGFNNEFKIYNFDFSFNVFARVGQMFVSDYANKFEPNAIENGAVVNYWTPANPTNDYPRPNASISRAALPFATTLGYKDGSYFKIRNITVGYTFPQKVAQKLHINGLRWYMSAKNYFIFSNVSNYDPEGAGSFEKPLTKLIVTGINIDL
jgi:TonB-linked SusC/RagA family outer membrane protein